MLPNKRTAKLEKPFHFQASGLSQHEVLTLERSAESWARVSESRTGCWTRYSLLVSSKRGPPSPRTSEAGQGALQAAAQLEWVKIRPCSSTRGPRGARARGLSSGLVCIRRPLVAIISLAWRFRWHGSQAQRASRKCGAEGEVFGAPNFNPAKRFREEGAESLS